MARVHRPPTPRDRVRFDRPASDDRVETPRPERPFNAERPPFRDRPAYRDRAPFNDRPPFGERSGTSDRPTFRDTGPRPFVPRPRPEAEPVHSLRLRDGDREFEVSGSPAFVRQALDDLPVLLGRLRGAPSSRPASISVPVAPAAEPVAAVPATPASDAGAPASPPPSAIAEASTNGSLEAQVFAVLRRSRRPLTVATIRERLHGVEATGQQVRRILERASDKVAASGARPTSYGLR